jgi:hypothetical protein
MDTNFYALETLVAARLAEAEAHAQRRSLLVQARRRRPFRQWLGLRLIAAARWLCGGPALATVRTS